MPTKQPLSPLFRSRKGQNPCFFYFNLMLGRLSNYKACCQAVPQLFSIPFSAIYACGPLTPFHLVIYALCSVIYVFYTLSNTETFREKKLIYVQKFKLRFQLQDLRNNLQQRSRKDFFSFKNRLCKCHSSVCIKSPQCHNFNLITRDFLGELLKAMKELRNLILVMCITASELGQ